MRNYKNIFITEYDFGKLNEMIDNIRKENTKDNGFVDKLRNEMNRAKIVSPAKINGNIVTMNSRVLLKDLDTHHEFSCQVVYPSDADLETGKISVLAPVGTALLGYKVGDIIKWEVPSGVRNLKIKEMLYQPESEGDLYQ